MSNLDPTHRNSHLYGPQSTPGREESNERAHAERSRASKRPRVNAACEACKTRKLGCSGDDPCMRCVQDRKPCVYLRKERRSPLTRERMTELEERVYHYEVLWSSLFSGYPLSDAAEDALRHGMSTAVQRATNHFRHSHSASNSDHPPLPLPLPLSPVHHNSDIRPTWSPTHIRSIPPTRPVSPDTNTYMLQANPEGYGGDYEWQGERHGAQPEADAGMASLAPSGKGASYFGLSSGATFLNAIRRLSPQTVSELSPNGAFLASGSLASGAWADVGNDWRSTSLKQSTKGGSRTTLPPLAETMPLLESYFRYFHPLTPIVHEPTIRAQVLGALPISKTGSDVLIYMIFAMGALDLMRSEEDDDGNRHYEVARQALQENMLEGGTLPLVQGLAIMANYLQRSNRPNAGYICLGWAIRMATALGLHTNPVSGNQYSALEKEVRKRVWWSIVTLEAGCAVTFGRPHAHGLWQLAAVPLPINCNDEHLTVSSDTPPPDSDDSTLYTALIVQARLAGVTCGIHETILQSNPAPSVIQLRRYDDRITSVLQSLPEYMQTWGTGPYQLSRAVQVWRARDFRAILHRPLLLAAAWDSSKRQASLPGVREAIEACRSLAVDNLEDIGKFVLTEVHVGRGAEWYTLYFAFQASLALLLSIIWEPNHSSAMTWRGILISTAAWFRQIQSMRTLASAYAKILESIVGIEPSAVAMDPLEQFAQLLGANAESTSSGGGANAQAEIAGQGELDFERYWREIWGSDNTFFDSNLPPADVSQPPNNGWMY